MIDLKALGRRVAMLRRQSAASRQEDLAAALDLSRSTIAGVESGADGPSLELAVQLADHFKVPMDYLLCRTVPPGGPLVGQFVDDVDELAWVSFWKTLDDSERAAATKMLRIPPIKPPD
jgi:DNA-binding XRE family transcriptional regulator